MKWLWLLLMTGCGDAFTEQTTSFRAIYPDAGSDPDATGIPSSDGDGSGGGDSTGGGGQAEGGRVVDGGLSGMGGLAGAGPTDAGGQQCPTVECVANCQYLGMVALCDDASCQCA